MHVGIPWIVVLAFCRLMTHPVISRVKRGQSV